MTIRKYIIKLRLHIIVIPRYTTIYALFPVSVYTFRVPSVPGESLMSVPRGNNYRLALE